MAIEKLDSEKLKNLADEMRASVIKLGYAAGKRGAHFGGALSCIEILACLYGGVMDIDVKNPRHEDRDVFLLSKGHASLAFYVALAYAGYFSMEDLRSFEQDGSELPGHPVMNLDRGIELSSGSLGMGIGVGIGMALGYRRKGIDKHIFVLMGDGECDEGSVWEGAMSAAAFKLDSLVVIVDRNGIQCDGTTKDVLDSADLAAKFASFGFDVHEVAGHDIPELLSILQQATSDKNEKPKVIIADTVKGKGISFMENQAEWHHGVLSEAQYKEAMQELGREVI